MQAVGAVETAGCVTGATWLCAGVRGRLYHVGRGCMDAPWFMWGQQRKRMDACLHIGTAP